MAAVLEYIEAKQTQGKKISDLDGDVTKSYRMNTQFMFECVLCWFVLGSISYILLELIGSRTSYKSSV